MIELLREVVDHAGMRRYVRSVKERAGLHEWVLGQTAFLPPDAELSERIYVLLKGREQSFCQYEQHKKFNTFEKGYRFCSNDCRCRREEQARKIGVIQASRTLEEKQATVAAMQATCRERYGADNYMSTTAGQQSFRTAFNVKHGVDWPTQSAVIQQKAKATMLARYGVERPFESAVIRAQAAATFEANHGRPNDMAHVRAAYVAQTGYCNPFANPVVIERIRRKWIARFGVDHPMKSEEVIVRMQRHLGRNTASQSKIGDAAWALVSERERFAEFMKDKSLGTAAALLDLNPNTISRWMVRHGMEPPGRSSYEKEIKAWLKSIGVEFIQNTKSLIKPFEIDFAIPSALLGIEFSSLYYHCERMGKYPMYHFEKWRAMNELGWSLITIFEDEWLEHQHVVKSRLLHLLGANQRPKIGARLLRIASLDWSTCRDFLTEHHLQGAGTPASKRLGAYHGDRLVAVMTFTRNGRRTADWELSRFVTDGGSYPGVASRLLTRFRREFPDVEITSLSDNRWSDGDLYLRLGFVMDAHLKPDYSYCDPKKLKRWDKRRFRKQRIGVTDVTEKVATERMGLDRIWDCGKVRWRLKPG